jgi:hypothetical protein
MHLPALHKAAYCDRAYFNEAEYIFLSVIYNEGILKNNFSLADIKSLAYSAL